MTAPMSAFSVKRTLACGIVNVRIGSRIQLVAQLNQRKSDEVTNFWCLNRPKLVAQG